VDEQLIQSVEDLGLSQKEARVYLSNLALGSATVQQIADHSGIKRVTTYVILESLANLGLVSQTSQGKKTFFNAEDPVVLRRLMDKKEQEVNDQKHHFEDILPQLKTLKSLPKEAPGVKFYDTREGIKAMVASFFAAHRQDTQRSLGVSNIDQLFGFFPEFAAAQSNPERVKMKIKSRLIYTSKDGAILKDSDVAKNRESRFVPSQKFPFKGDFNVVGNHIVLLSFSASKPVGITIDSTELADGLTAIFDLAWEAAGQYSKP